MILPTISHYILCCPAAYDTALLQVVKLTRILSAKIVSGGSHHSGCHQQRCGHGRDRHQCERAVNQIDDHVDTDDRTGEQREDIEVVVVVPVVCSHQKVQTFGAVVGVGEHGGGTENQYRSQQQPSAGHRNASFKTPGGHRDPIYRGIGPYTGHQEGKCCHGADKQGIDGRFQHRHQAFAYRFTRLCGSMSHGLHPDSRFIGECASADPIGDHHTDSSTCSCLASECITDNQTDVVGQV